MKANGFGSGIRIGILLFLSFVILYFSVFFALYDPFLIAYDYYPTDRPGVGIHDISGHSLYMMVPVSCGKRQWIKDYIFYVKPWFFEFADVIYVPPNYILAKMHENMYVE